MSPVTKAEAVGGIAFLLLLAGILAGPGQGGSDTSPIDVESACQGWPPTAKQAAEEMIHKYGPPDESTSSMLVWHNNGPWKRTIVYREEVEHHFPKPHKDVLEQFIDYRVPPKMFDDLAEYDGSVIIERTKGEVSARCDKEAMNFLALNLMNDIVTKKRNEQKARKFYAETVADVMKGETPDYTLRFLFALPQGDTADLDEPIMDDLTQR